MGKNTEQLMKQMGTSAQNTGGNNYSSAGATYPSTAALMQQLYGSGSSQPVQPVQMVPDTPMTKDIYDKSSSAKAQAKKLEPNIWQRLVNYGNSVGDPYAGYAVDPLSEGQITGRRYGTDIGVAEKNAKEKEREFVSWRDALDKVGQVVSTGVQEKIADSQLTPAQRAAKAYQDEQDALLEASQGGGTAAPETPVQTANLDELTKQRDELQAEYNALNNSVMWGKYGVDYTSEDNDRLVEMETQLNELNDQIKALTPKADWGGVLGHSITTGLAQLSNSAAAGLDAVFGKGAILGGFLDEIETMLGVTWNDTIGEATGVYAPEADMPNPFTALHSGTQSDVNYFTGKLEAAENGNPVAQFVGKHLSSVAQNAPFLLVSWLAAPAEMTTAGVTYLGNLFKSAPGLDAVRTIVANALPSLASNPTVQYSFMQSFGSGYEDAKSGGASDVKALLYASINAAYNAIIEVGGMEGGSGLDALPASLRGEAAEGGTHWIWKLLDTVTDEIKEEELQGLLERGLKTIYTEVAPASLTDQNAILNPDVIIQTAIDTAIDTTLMGGAEMGIAAGINAIQSGPAVDPADAYVAAVEAQQQEAAQKNGPYKVTPHPKSGFVPTQETDTGTGTPARQDSKSPVMDEAGDFDAETEEKAETPAPTGTPGTPSVPKPGQPTGQGTDTATGGKKIVYTGTSGTGYTQAQIDALSALSNETLIVAAEASYTMPYDKMGITEEQADALRKLGMLDTETTEDGDTFEFLPDVYIFDERGRRRQGSSTERESKPAPNPESGMHPERVTDTGTRAVPEEESAGEPRRSGEELAEDQAPEGRKVKVAPHRSGEERAEEQAPEGRKTEKQSEEETRAGQAAAPTGKKSAPSPKRATDTGTRAAAEATGTQGATATESTKGTKAQPKTVLGRAISGAFEEEGVSLSNDAVQTLEAAYEGDEADAIPYVEEVRKVFKQGAEGKTLAEAQESANEILTPAQVRTAWSLGAASTDTQVRQTEELRNNLASLGTHAEEAVEVYEAGQDVESFAPGMLTVVEAVASTGKTASAGTYTSGPASTLTGAQIARANEIGLAVRKERAARVRRQAQAQAKTRQQAAGLPTPAKGGKVIFARKDGELYGHKYRAVDKTKLNRTQRAVVRIAEAIAKATGLQIRIADFETDPIHKVGGLYLQGSADGILYLNIGANYHGANISAGSLFHELTHWLKEYDSAGYAELRDIVLNAINENPQEFADILGDRAGKQPNLTTEKLTNEMVANACQKLFTDEESIRDFAQQHQNLFERLRDLILRLIDNFKAAFAEFDTESDFTLMREVRAAEGELDRIREAWMKAFAGAAENMQAERAVAEARTSTEIGPIDLADYTAARNTDGKPLFQIYAFEHDEPEYREMLEKWGGMSDTDIDRLFAAVDEATGIIKANLEALDYAWEADINDRGFLPVKQNSDKLYKVSQDFSTLCRKRILQGAIQNQLQAALDRALTRDEGIAIRDALLALQEEGKQIEVACALCYVESARMKTPEQIQNFLDDREKVLRDYFANKDRGASKQRIADADRAERQKINDENNGKVRGKNGDIVDVMTAPMNKLDQEHSKRIKNARRAARSQHRYTEAQQRIVNEAMEMSISDFTTPEGLENLAKHHREIFDAYTSYVRAAAHSKGIENDTWWRAGDSYKMIGDRLIEQMNAENGLRTQSWSDFQVKHLMDYIAATIELSTRGAQQHAYTKVADYVDLMGDTGVMINMSLIPTQEFNGKLEFDDVEGFVYKEAMRLRNKYHKTSGTICIGMGIEQIRQLLASDKIDYVIPYHQSGMSKDTRKAMHIPAWKDFQSYQNEKALKGQEAEENAARFGVQLLSEEDQNWHKAPKFSEWFDMERARSEADVVGKNGKYGVMTGGYAAMQSAAENYKKMCAERGLAPKFSYGESDFSGEDNYWKLLIDRKMVDNVTGEIIEQQAIKPVFDIDTIKRILNDELKRYGTVKADQNEATRRVTEAFLSGKIKAGMTQDAIREVMQKQVDDISITNITQNALEMSVYNNKAESLADAALEDNEPAASEVEVLYSLWDDEPPKKTQYGFKLMTVKKVGNKWLPTAMFIDRANPYEFGVWYKADSPKLENLIHLEPGYSYLIDENDNADMETRRPFKKTTRLNKKGQKQTSYTQLPSVGDIDKATLDGKRWMLVDRYADGGVNIQNLGVNGSGSVSKFALRPGIHAVDIPSMAHIGAVDNVNGGKKRRTNERWFLIEYPVDVDYNQEAYSHESKDIRDHLPTGGWYSYQTNSGAEARQHWFITGGMKIVGAVSEADVRKYAKDRGFEQDLQWRDGKVYSEDDAIDLDEYLRTTTAQPTPSKDEMRQRIESGVQLQTWDEEPVYNNRALVSEETIDKWLTGGWFGSNTNPNYAQAYIAYMSPKQYLRMSTIYDESRIHAESADRTMDWVKDASEAQPIQLKIDTAEGKVWDHEGRHRMSVLDRNGVHHVPVLLFDLDNKYSKEPISELKLEGQNFNGIRNYATTTVTDLIPLNRAHREEILEKFSKKTSFEKISEKYDRYNTVQFQAWDAVEFGNKVQDWYDNTTEEQRKIDPGIFKVGTISEPLKSIGVKDGLLIWGKSKVESILEDHAGEGIDIVVIKQVPDITERPVFVLKSKTVPTSMVLFGTVKTKRGRNMLATVSLTPGIGKNLKVDLSVITGSYSRRKNQIRNMLKTSEILYVDSSDENKRTNEWLKQLGLQLPSRTPNVGPVGTVTYKGKTVNISGKKWADLYEDTGDNDTGTTALTQTWDETGNDDTEEEKRGRSAAYARLQGENAILNEAVAALRKLNAKQDKTIAALQKRLRLTKTPEVRENDARKLARTLIRENSSRADVDSVAAKIRAVGSYLLQTEAAKLDEEVLKDRARTAAREILESATEDADPEGGGLEINPFDAYMPEATEELANRIVMDALNGVLRPEPATDADKAKARNQALRDQIKDLKRQNKMSDREGARLYQTIYDLSNELDRAQSRYKTLQAKADYRMEQVRAQGAARAAEVKARERARAEGLLAAQKQHYLDIAERARERRNDAANRRELRGKIEKLWKDLNRRLTNPTEKKHIPAELVGQASEILQALADSMDTSREGTKASETLRARLAEFKAAYDALQNDEDYRKRAVYDPVVAEALQNMVESIGDTKLNNMSAAQMQSVLDVLTMLDKTARDALKVQLAGEEVEAYKASEDMTRETRSVGKEHKGLFAKYIQAGLSPERAFKLFGGHHLRGMWEKVYRMLNEGQLKATQIQVEGEALFGDLLTGKDFERAIDYHRTEDVGLKDRDGKAVPLTHGLMTAMYVQMEDPEALWHIVDGGYTVPNLKDYYTGKNNRGMDNAVRVAGVSVELSEASHAVREAEQALREAKKLGDEDAISEAQRDLDNAKADLEEVKTRGYEMANAWRQAIEEKLTDYDRKVADVLRRLYREYSAEKLNETTMQVYGIKKATNPTYYPITSDKNFLNTPFESVARDMSLENVGFMKERVNSGNPIYLFDAFDMAETQIRRVAQYSGLMPAIRDFNKIWNKVQFGYNDSLQQAMSEKFGKAGLDYIEHLMADLNGARGRDNGTLANMFEALRGNRARAALTMSVPTALAQAASYPTAASVVGWGALGSGFARAAAADKLGVSEKTRNLIAKYSPLWAYRMKGYSQAELGDIAASNRKADRIFKKARWLTGWIQAMDGKTTAALWYAAEEYVKGQQKDLKPGSDEFYQEVAKVYNDILEKTQPNYTTMQRPEILRDPNALVRQLTMFMTQRLQNFNILYDAVKTANQVRTDYRNKVEGVTRQDVEETARTARRAISSQIVAAATIVAFKTLANMLLHRMNPYRDDDDELTPESISLALLDMFLDTITSNFLFGSEIYDVVEHYAFGGKYYGIDVSSVAAINDATESLIKLVDTAAKEGWNPDKLMPQARKIGMNLANALGIPAENGVKIATAVIQHAEDIKNGEFLSFEAGVDRTTAQQARRIYQAYIEGRYADANKIREEFGDDEKLNSALSTLIRDQVKDGTLKASEAERQLTRFVGWDKDKASNAVLNDRCEAETGIQYNKIADALRDGEIDERKAAQMWQKYGGMTSDVATSKASWTLYSAKYPKTQLDANSYRTWYVKVKGSGVPAETYATIKNGADADGNGSISSNEAYDVLASAVNSGKITMDQAEVLWSVFLPTSKKKFSTYRRK